MGRMHSKAKDTTRDQTNEYQASLIGLLSTGESLGIIVYEPLFVESIEKKRETDLELSAERSIIKSWLWKRTQNN